MIMRIVHTNKNTNRNTTKTNTNTTNTIQPYHWGDDEAKRRSKSSKITV